MRRVPPGHSIGRDLVQVCVDIRAAASVSGKTALRAAVLQLRNDHVARGLPVLNLVALGLTKGADISVRDGGANRAKLTAQQLTDVATADLGWETLKGLLMDAFAPADLPQAIIDILRA